MLFDFSIDIYRTIMHSSRMRTVAVAARRGGVSQHALDRGECVSQHAVGRGCLPGEVSATGGVCWGRVSARGDVSAKGGVSQGVSARHPL